MIKTFKVTKEIIARSIELQSQPNYQLCRTCPVALVMAEVIPDVEVGLWSWDSTELEATGDLPEAVESFINIFDTAQGPAKLQLEGIEFELDIPELTN